MKDSKTLLLEYLASVRGPERAASLFAEDRAFELPFLRSLGVEPRHTSRREIAGLIHQLLKLYPAGRDARQRCRYDIDTLDQHKLTQSGVSSWSV